MPPLSRISDQEFLELSAIVYAWICAADGSTTREEIKGYIRFLESLPYVDQISEEDFSVVFLDTISQFNDHYETSKESASEKLKLVTAELDLAKDLIRVARRALVSDQKITELEETALSEISAILNVDESNLD